MDTSPVRAGPIEHFYDTQEEDLDSSAGFFTLSAQ
jgi:hypothetical protein